VAEVAMKMYNLLSLPHLLAKHIRGKKTINRLFQITHCDFGSIFKYPIEETTWRK
jgi:hypothetical protein